MINIDALHTQKLHLIKKETYLVNMIFTQNWQSYIGISPLLDDVRLKSKILKLVDDFKLDLYKKVQNNSISLKSPISENLTLENDEILK